MKIERAERAALHIFVSGVGVAMMGVAVPLAFPDAPKTFWQVIVSFGGAITFLSATFLIYEYRESIRRKRMISVLGMFISGVLFVAFAGWHFWPSKDVSMDSKSIELPPIADELLLECQLAALPEVGPPNQTMLFKIDPFRFADLGTIGYGTVPTEPGKSLPWPAEWKNRVQSSARCRVTNYGTTTLFNIEIPFKITFVRIERGENPSSTIGNKVINIVDGSVPITKLEPGSAGAYVFYIHNQGKDIIRPQFSDSATCLPLGGIGRASVKVIQPADAMHHAGALWPVRDAIDIINEAEGSKSPLETPAPALSPPRTQEKK